MGMSKRVPFIVCLLLSVCVAAGQAAAGIGERDWKDQYSYSEVQKAAKDLAEKYPDYVSYQVLGQSVKKRDLFSIQIRDKSIPNLPSTLMVAGLSSNSGQTSKVLYDVLNKLLSAPKHERLLEELVHKVAITAVPILNPDAYSLDTQEITFKNGRDTCSRDSHKSGVDITRNFGVAFDSYLPKSQSESLRSKYEDVCSHVYHGPDSFSEPEVEILKKLVSSISPKSAVFLTSSTGSTASVTLPYTHFPGTQQTQARFNLIHTEDVHVFTDIVQAMTGAKQGTQYQTGTHYDLTNQTRSGSELDWIFGSEGAFAIEMGIPVHESEHAVLAEAAEHVNPMVEFIAMTRRIPSKHTPKTPLSTHIRKTITLGPLILGLVLTGVLLAGFGIARMAGYDDLWGRFRRGVERIVNRGRGYQGVKELDEESIDGVGLEDLEWEEGEGFSYER